MKALVEICKETSCKLRTLPGIYQLVNGEVNVSKLRDVDVEDLLGRDPIKGRSGFYLKLCEKSSDHGDGRRRLDRE